MASWVGPVRCQISAHFCSVLWAFNVRAKQALSSLWLFIKSASARYSENARDFKAKKVLIKFVFCVWNYTICRRLLFSRFFEMKFRHLSLLIYSNTLHSWASLYHVTETLALDFTVSNVANTSCDRLHSDTGWTEITAVWKCVLPWPRNETHSQSALFLRVLQSCQAV